MSAPNHDSAVVQFEDAVLNGSALVVLNLPGPLLQDGALLKLIEKTLPHAGVTRVLLHPSDVIMSPATEMATEQLDAKECGGIFFGSAAEAWKVLERIKMILQTRDGPLELRRGYLTLDSYEILVEGVLTWSGKTTAEAASGDHRKKNEEDCSTGSSSSSKVSNNGRSSPDTHMSGSSRGPSSKKNSPTSQNGGGKVAAVKGEQSAERTSRTKSPPSAHFPAAPLPDGQDPTSTFYEASPALNPSNAGSAAKPLAPRQMTVGSTGEARVPSGQGEPVGAKLEVPANTARAAPRQAPSLSPSLTLHPQSTASAPTAPAKASRAGQNRDMNRPNQQRDAAASVSSSSSLPVVIAVMMKELFSRHSGDSRPSHAVTPFMVYQMLISECTPRKIAVVGGRSADGRNHSNTGQLTLVQLDSVAEAQHAIDVFNNRVVDFSSPQQEQQSRNTDQRRSRAAKGGDAALNDDNITSEVRYAVHIDFSTQRGMPRFLPDGTRNYHRYLEVSSNTSSCMAADSLESQERLQLAAPRQWRLDPYSQRRAQKTEEKPAHQAALAADNSANGERSGPDRRRRKRDHSSRERYKRHRRSQSPASSSESSYSTSQRISSATKVNHRSRVPVAHPLSHASQSHPAPSPSPYPTTAVTVPTAIPPAVASTGSAAHSHPCQHSSSGSSGTTLPPSTSAHGTWNVEPSTRGRPTAALHPGTTYASGGTPSGGKPASSTATTAVEPLASHYDEKGPLPPGWRPIFSTEYQQTYYAYRNPLTGTEVTTWERP